MNVLISFLLAAAPAVGILIYYYRQDRAKPEPKGLVLRVFLLGVLSTAVAVPLELLVSTFDAFFARSPLLYYLFKAFIVAALVEEYLKMTVVRLAVYRNVNFDEIMDGVLYTVVASLGFACMENVLYVLGGTLWTALLRAFTAIPLHATASGLMGYYIGRAKFASSEIEERELFRHGLWTAVGFHGSYNFLLFTVPLFGIAPSLGIVPLLLVAFFTLRRRIRAAIAEDRRQGRLPDES
jgi:RsiW-degrading membrane proteinase PrsW (M82 family)